MQVFINIIILVLMMGFLVMIHELGHFLWAKKFGVHIYEFSIGMGPLIKTIKGKDGIDYSIRAFPIGGYVSMAGEVYEDDKKIKKDKLLCNKVWWQRLIIICAGVVNNFIAAIVILFAISLIWGAGFATNEVNNVTENYPIAEAGIVPGDKIIAVNNYKIKNADNLSILLAYKDSDGVYEFEIEHQDGKIETYKVTPKEEEKEGQKVKVFGVHLKINETKGFIKSLKYGVVKFGLIMEQMWLTISGLFTGKISVNALSGPVGIYSVVGATAKQGIANLLMLTAFLSINLGFINILPFPAFDGGRAFFILLEKIIGKKIDSNIENMFHTIGFILIMALMVYITIHDIIRLF